MSLTFLYKNPEAILRDIISAHQANSGRVLYPSQIENLEMHTLAYRESLLRNDIQFAAEQNLIRYAVGEHLDELGVMFDTPRLQPVSAECRVRFRLDNPSPNGRTFPAGTRVGTQDGKVLFETVAPCYVISGRTESTEALARCIETGTGGNGLAAGVLCSVDPPENGVSVENVTATNLGGDLETDEAYRERLTLAAAALGSGGTTAGYRYWTLSASTLVSDAFPQKGQERGDIEVYVLSQDGTPTQELLEEVSKTLNSDDVRLINDYVITLPAVRREYQIKAEITVADNHNRDWILDRVSALANEFAKQKQLKLGTHITPTQLLMALSPVQDGLYNVNLIEPAEIIVTEKNEFPQAMEIDIRGEG